MSKEMLNVVEFIDVVGQRNLLVFSSRTEAEEFIDIGFKRWHFAGLEYHYYTPEEYVEERMKLK